MALSFMKTVKGYISVKDFLVRLRKDVDTNLRNRKKELKITNHRRINYYQMIHTP